MLRYSALYFLISFVLNPASSIALTQFNTQETIKNFECYGGGYDYLIQSVQKKYQYSQFIEKYPNCKKLNESGFDGQKITTVIRQIDQIAKQIVQEKKCPELIKILKNFQNIKIQNLTAWKSFTKKRAQSIFSKTPWLDSHYEKLSIVNLTQDYKGTQVRSTSLANTAILCGASDMSFKLRPYFLLEVALRGETSHYSRTESVTVDGETTNSCFNVQAQGSEDLNKFFINIVSADKSRPLVLKYETYTAKDQIILSDGKKVIFDSGCRSTSEVHEVMINIQKVTSNKIKVLVNSSCNGENGTFWNFQLQCDQQVSKPFNSTPIACTNPSSKLKKLIKEYYELSDNIHEHYWMKSNCYMQHYKELGEELLIQDTLLFTQEVRPCGEFDYCPKILSKNSYAISPLSNITAVKKGKLVERSPAVKTNRRLQKGTVFEKNKEHFIKNKSWFCIPKKSSLELFDRISKRYCLSGYPYLLNE